MEMKNESSTSRCEKISIYSSNEFRFFNVESYRARLKHENDVREMKNQQKLSKWERKRKESEKEREREVMGKAAMEQNFSSP